MYLDTQLKLKEFIFRSLGSEFHEVEITDSQYSDILFSSFKELKNYSDDGSYEAMVEIQINNEEKIKIDKSILAIKKVYSSTSLLSNSLAGQAYTTDLVFNSMMSGNSNQNLLVNFVESMHYLKNHQDLLEQQVDYDFNPESGTLSIKGVVEVIYAECLVAEDLDDLLESELLHLLLKSKCLRQWSDNINIKYNMVDADISGNGLKLNPEKMLESAVGLEEEIKEGHEEGRWGSYHLPPMNLY